MPRFVVLHHRLPASSERNDHFDMMLEYGQSLRTWALPAWPIGEDAVPADRLADHRCEYLDYEGPVSEDRGEVTRVVSGHYELISESADGLTICLLESEERLEEQREGQGGSTFVLQRCDAGQRWTFKRLG